MKIFNLTTDSDIYTSNAYFVLGSWKAIEDVNALIDVGRDPSVLEKINHLDTGVGKKKLEKVVLTHGHFDHVGLLPVLRDRFDPDVYAFHSFDGVNHVLKDGQTLKLGDRRFEVIHTPGHTSDSICLYCEEDGALFSGDSPLIITSQNSTYQDDFIDALKRIAKKDIKVIYPGHGEPITRRVKRLLYISLDNIRKS